ncbi:type II toxin-antitoxin system RelE/ParE family toxin [Derxia gummosa]|uniref:Type II toxin-antitoxin system RelE/ParE family toxin n=1 Tax=Derxia gummosa DSM 723 TaxID=1121388 RepID=A0A8B6X2S1_9BURK|nr:type II toxin-antitoxin system RelE/ParE family toxin [Derxia gummosa]
MASVATTRRALADLDGVWDYIAADNADAADRFLDELRCFLDLIATQPLMGRARPELAPAVRSLPFQRYVLFYRPQADGIELVRFLHASRDIAADSFS